jgi:phage terminase large subunit
MNISLFGHRIEKFVVLWGKKKNHKTASVIQEFKALLNAIQLWNQIQIAKSKLKKIET